MYAKLINKMISHFGQDGILMFSKSNDYYKTNPISIEDIKMYYELLTTNEQIPTYVRKASHMACCLYYLTKTDPRYKDILLTKILGKLSGKNDQVDDPYLFIIYNVIEYEIVYLHSDKKKINFLFSYLERFSGLRKTFENFLLYKYYRGILLLSLGKVNEAMGEYLEIVNKIADERSQKSQYLEYISLKNDLFYANLIKNQGKEEDLTEQYIFLKDLYERIKNENKLLAVKIGFTLSSILYKQSRFSECIQVLNDMKHTLKTELMSGMNMQNGLDYSLAILSRIGFISTLTNDKELIEKTIRKIEQSVNLFQNDKNNKKLMMFFKGYTFLCTLLKINNGQLVPNSKEIASYFRTLLPADLAKSPNPQEFLVNNENLPDCIINLNAINNMDYNISSKAQQIIDICVNNVRGNNPLQHSMVLTFIVGVHDIINRLSESYCTDSNTSKRKDYCNKIFNYSENVFKYVKTYADSQPLLECNFIKSLLIRIYSALAHIYIYNHDYDNLKPRITFFDDIAKTLSIKEKTPSYELVLKVKGDYWFYKKDYAASVAYYKKAVDIIDNDDPKRAVIFFNLGCGCFFNNDKNGAVENLNKCVTSFRNLEQNKKTLDFYKRPDVIDKKVTLANNLLKQLTIKS